MIRFALLAHSLFGPFFTCRFIIIDRRSSAIQLKSFVGGSEIANKLLNAFLMSVAFIEFTILAHALVCACSCVFTMWAFDVLDVHMHISVITPTSHVTQTSETRKIHGLPSLRDSNFIYIRCKQWQIIRLAMHFRKIVWIYVDIIYMSRHSIGHATREINCSSCHVRRTAKTMRLMWLMPHHFTEFISFRSNSISFTISFTSLMCNVREWHTHTHTQIYLEVSPSVLVFFSGVIDFQSAQMTDVSFRARLSLMCCYCYLITATGVTPHSTHTHTREHTVHALSEMCIQLNYPSQ